MLRDLVFNFIVASKTCKIAHDRICKIFVHLPYCFLKFLRSKISDKQPNPQKNQQHFRKFQKTRKIFQFFTIFPVIINRSADFCAFTNSLFTDCLLIFRPAIGMIFIQNIAQIRNAHIFLQDIKRVFLAFKIIN